MLLSRPIFVPLENPSKEVVIFATIYVILVWRCIVHSCLEVQSLLQAVPYTRVYWDLDPRIEKETWH
jgi:hypothetical protein